MTTPNQLFASHVTSVAFSLSLSKTMVCCLVEIAENRDARARQYRVMKAMGLRDTWVSAARCLVERGLIMAPDPEWPGIFVLTEPGEHVLALLQIAGIVEKITTKMGEVV